MNNLLELGKPISAVFAAGDTMAIGALKNAGLKVPDDFSVVGFDDIEFSSIFEPALTTIRQPKFLIGQTAFEKLFKIMNGAPLDSLKDILDYEVVVRESSGVNRHK